MKYLLVCHVDHPRPTGILIHRISTNSCHKFQNRTFEVIAINSADHNEIVGRGGSLIDSSPFILRVAGSNLALATT